MIGLLLLCVAVGVGALAVNVTVLDQTNLAERWPALGNRVRCQNITDIYRQPLVMAADDAVVPGLAFFQDQGVARGLQDCSAMTFRFGGIRIRSLSNPQSVTVVFMRDTAGQSAPGSVFYQKSLPAPTNNYLWLQDQGLLGRPWSYEVTLQWNELADDGQTRFDFRSAEFLPPLRTFWVGFYCTGPQQSIGGVRINAMFWVTQSNVSNATALSPALAGGVANQPFFFRDVTNILGAGFTNWTPAAVYQQNQGPVAPTGQMAWRLFFTCGLTPTAAPTPATEAPTAAPTPPVLLTSEPPTEAPLDATNTSNFTLTGAASNALVAALVPSLLACSCCATLCAVYYIRRRRRRREAEKSATPQETVHYTDPYTKHQKKQQKKQQFDDYRDLALQHHEPILSRYDETGLGGKNPLTRATMLSVYDDKVNTSSDAGEYDHLDV